MKKKSLLMVLLVLLCAALLFSACGRKSASSADPTAPAFDMKSFEGVYAEEVARRGVLQLTATDATSAEIAIDWPTSSLQSSSWKMSGTYDANQNAIVYSGAVLTETTTDAQGNKSENVVYTDGSGSFSLDNRKLNWTDNASVIQGSSSTFVYVMSLEDYAKQHASAPATQIPATSPTPAVTAAPTVPSPTPAVTAAPAEPSPTSAVTAAPTAPSPSPSPNAADAAKLPKITKSPTNETVTEGGHCYFLAKYEDAIWAVWHFVSPDGTRDLTYEEAAKEFPKMQIEGGMYSQMKLSNIPLDISGWKVYCQYSNRSGSANTDTATITVNPKGGAAPGTTGTTGGKLPTVTKSPTSETVPEGGNAIFQARYEDAIWAVWHFVSPDGTRDLTYEEAAKEFPKMQILNGNYSQLLLKSIPAEVNGWKVYCRYSNHDGAVDTDSATITVIPKGGTAPASPAPSPGTGNPADAPKITKSPTSETVAEGGTCYFVAKYENAIWAVWHFVSPDGTRDLTYEEAGKEFTTLKIENGMYSQMKLSNIPAALNGWKVYCRYSNRSASADTQMASITVTSKGTPVPTPTPAAGDSVIVTTPDPNATVTPAPADVPYVADWTSVSDFSEAVNGSGVSFSLPVSVPDGMSIKGYRYKTGSIEVSYGDNAGNTMTIRKSNTDSGNALSGDTNIYPAAWQMSVKGLTVTCKGRNDQSGTSINAATFGYNGYNYSVTCNTAQDGKGLTQDQLTSVINGMQ